MQKIIIIGFPHCGTTILRSIIGHIDSVKEIVKETQIIRKQDMLNIKDNIKFILCKFPACREIFFSEKYYDYIKILIVRNPFFVFSSLHKRNKSGKMNYDNFSAKLNTYVKTCEKYLFYKNNPSKNVYVIKYEDLFKDNFKKLKTILNNLKLDYTDEIFDNKLYTNRVTLKTKIPTSMPKEYNHAEYRSWQINQLYINNNNIHNICLSDKEKKLITENTIIKQLYTFDKNLH